jgi:RecB family exonuclease
MRIPVAWSFSSWEQHTMCPLRYKLERIDKLPVPAVPAFARGTAVHDAIAAYLTKQSDALPADVKSPYQQKLYGEIREFIPAPMVEQKWAFTSEWRNTGWTRPDTWLRAVCDVAVMYDDGGLEVIDHKTGKPRSESDDQMELFALASRARFPQVRDVTTRLVYVDAATETTRRWTAHELVALRAKWAARATVVLQDREWLPRPNEKCRWCPFSKSEGGPCRYG